MIGAELKGNHEVIIGESNFRAINLKRFTCETFLRGSLEDKQIRNFWGLLLPKLRVNTTKYNYRVMLSIRFVLIDSLLALLMDVENMRPFVALLNLIRVIKICAIRHEMRMNDESVQHFNLAIDFFQNTQFGKRNDLSEDLRTCLIQLVGLFQATNIAFIPNHLSVIPPYSIKDDMDADNLNLLPNAQSAVNEIERIKRDGGETMAIQSSITRSTFIFSPTPQLFNIPYVNYAEFLRNLPPLQNFMLERAENLHNVVVRFNDELIGDIISALRHITHLRAISRDAEHNRDKCLCVNITQEI